MSRIVVLIVLSCLLEELVDAPLLESNLESISITKPVWLISRPLAISTYTKTFLVLLEQRRALIVIGFPQASQIL